MRLSSNPLAGLGVDGAYAETAADHRVWIQRRLRHASRDQHAILRSIVGPESAPLLSSHVPREPGLSDATFADLVWILCVIADGQYKAVCGGRRVSFANGSLLAGGVADTWLLAGDLGCATQRAVEALLHAAVADRVAGRTPDLAARVCVASLLQLTGHTVTDPALVVVPEPARDPRETKDPLRDASISRPVTFDDALGALEAAGQAVARRTFYRHLKAAEPAFAAVRAGEVHELKPLPGWAGELLRSHHRYVRLEGDEAVRNSWLSRRARCAASGTGAGQMADSRTR